MRKCLDRERGICMIYKSSIFGSTIMTLVSLHIWDILSIFMGLAFIAGRWDGYKHPPVNTIPGIMGRIADVIFVLWLLKLPFFGLG